MDYFKNISYMMSHVFLMLFIYLFVPHRYGERKTAGICTASFFTLCLADCLKLNILQDSNVCYVITTVFQIFVTQFTGIFIARERNSKVLFMGLSASNYVIAGSIGAVVLHIGTGNEVLALIGSFVMHGVILVMLYQKIRDIWLRQCEKEYMKSWWELCLIPVFFYCGFSFLAFFPATLYENPQNIPGVIFFIITMFIAYVVVLRYVESESNRTDIYWKNVLFESYIKGLEDQYYLVGKSEQNLKILRHDMRHYSDMISCLLDQGEYDEIRNITDHINEVVKENKVVRYCRHLMVNTIIANMMERAHASDIEVHLDLDVPAELPVDDHEFSLVVANLFENAVICVKDFEKEKRHIEIKIHCTKEYLLIQTENQYKEEIIFDSVTGLPKSKKGRYHGLGMQSIQAFSDRIGGTIGCYCKEGVFRIVIFSRFGVTN